MFNPQDKDAREVAALMKVPLTPQYSSVQVLWSVRHVPTNGRSPRTEQTYSFAHLGTSLTADKT